MTTEADALILHYLQALESQLQDLPADRRQELLDEVSEHIAAARADLDPETEAGVRTMLARLGDPADIAAEARERFGLEVRPARPATPWLEVVTVALLVIPFLGWVLGAVLVWLSQLWTTRDKLVGTVGGLSWVLGGLGTVLAGRAGGPVGQPGADVGTTGPNPLELILVVAPFVLPVAAAIYLGIRLRGRAGAGHGLNLAAGRRRRIIPVAAGPGWMVRGRPATSPRRRRSPGGRRR
jgi:hypothetical protein